jgi:hypothetical protein
MGRRTHPAKLQQVDQLAQSRLVTSVGDSSGKRRLDASADRAAQQAVIADKREGRKHALTAHRTHFARGRMNLAETRLTHGQA